MRSSHPRVAVSLPGAHAAVRRRRLEDIVPAAVAGALHLVIALGITVAVPNPNSLLLIAGVLGVVGIGTLVTTARLEVTVPFLALYLGRLGGPGERGLAPDRLGAA